MEVLHNFKMEVKVYIINYRNPERKRRMENRLESLNLKYEIVEGVGKDDLFLPSELCHTPTAVMFSHLKAIKKFIDSGDEYGIIGEDDIHIRKTFNTDIGTIIQTFKELSLDVLLLGYLINFDIRNNYANFKELRKNNGYNYHEYPNDLWGTQLYMISRKYAQYILDKYNMEFLLKRGETPFASDWTISKDGKRAAIYPMLAVEEGNTSSDLSMYIDYHSSCRNFNFISNDFI